MISIIYGGKYLCCLVEVFLQNLPNGRCFPPPLVTPGFSFMSGRPLTTFPLNPVITTVPSSSVRSCDMLVCTWRGRQSCHVDRCVQEPNRGGRDCLQCPQKDQQPRGLHASPVAIFVFPPGLHSDPEAPHPCQATDTPCSYFQCPRASRLYQRHPRLGPSPPVPLPLSPSHRIECAAHILPVGKIYFLSFYIPPFLDH